ncbi:MAG: ABC transporter permease [Alphaproteobacteria bacterium]|nr:ABC transporter permease [Rhodospirillales bacterium]MCW9044847.1 ABC transporter permease [Alphaproteobacteria bacterium]
MIGYSLERLFHSAIVIIVMSFVIYGLMGLMPGDPIDLMISADPKLTPADAEHLRTLYGLDQPIFQRYINWLGTVFQGDLGYSRLFAQPVLEAIAPALFNTVKLLGLAIILSLLIALPVGIWAGSRPQTKTDYTINLLAFSGISIPPFWLALLLIIVFAVLLPILPASGLPTGEGGFWETLRHLILPVSTIVIASIGGHTRYMRASMIETLRQDYIRTAVAKGASPRRVVLSHALRNALIPVVTIIALDFGALFSGALITETIFSYPGMGKLIFDSIMGNDFNLALVALLFATFLTLIGNLLADLAYAWLDPRVSYKGRER